MLIVNDVSRLQRDKYPEIRYIDNITLGFQENPSSTQIRQLKLCKMFRIDVFFLQTDYGSIKCK